MYGIFLYSSSPIVGTINNLKPGVYDFYLYGFGQPASFQLAVDSPSYGSEATTYLADQLSPVWQDGVQYVKFTSVIISAPDQTVTVSTSPTLCGMQIASKIISPTNPPVVVNPPNPFVSIGQTVRVTNYAFSANGPVSFALASDAPAGATISSSGVFEWAPTCEQGTSTNLITVWATDSMRAPPLSNSITFSVIVGDCVEKPSIRARRSQAKALACQ